MKTAGKARFISIKGLMLFLVLTSLGATGVLLAFSMMMSEKNVQGIHQISTISSAQEAIIAANKSVNGLFTRISNITSTKQMAELESLPPAKPLKQQFDSASSKLGKALEDKQQMSRLSSSFNKLFADTENIAIRQGEYLAQKQQLGTLQTNFNSGAAELEKALSKLQGKMKLSIGLQQRRLKRLAAAGFDENDPDSARKLFESTNNYLGSKQSASIANIEKLSFTSQYLISITWELFSTSSIDELLSIKNNQAVQAIDELNSLLKLVNKDMSSSTKHSALLADIDKRLQEIVAIAFGDEDSIYQRKLALLTIDEQIVNLIFEASASSQQLDTVFGKVEAQVLDSRQQINSSTLEDSQESRSLLLSISTGVILFVLVMGFVVASYITNCLNGLSQALENIARGEGDLTVRLSAPKVKELSDISNNFNQFVATIEAAIIKVSAVTGKLDQASLSAAKQTSVLDNKINAQLSQVENVSAATSQMHSSIENTLDKTRMSGELSQQAHEFAASGEQVVEDVIEAMREISAASDRMSNIIGVIDEIAFTTNLLALNAAVEAARAGEQGRGFGVVAGEVRGLAQRSSGAAREISELIEDSLEKVESGTRLVTESGELLKQITVSSSNVRDNVQEVMQAMQEQKQQVQFVDNAMGSVETTNQQSAAMLQRVNANFEEVKQQSTDLLEMIEKFRFGEPRE
ncbi:methyl-accepting chemotaxis protein [Shewanella submarina]|uniref:Methyl-accepting chemotaxis protein n=1 Tax=Shewanella submarina TaxID=2016376 RepID=A0ABV7GAB3_9GAMM|nr:methyl-accepting chemotaxis protein [Shewanella submarina]MCL1037416.1 methyl-accepting chemotaxis protein [Shewanella submarina]